MTVSYNKDVISTSFKLMENNMIKLLFRWKGSVYRLIWDDCLMFLLLFAILSIIYRFALDADSRLHFEHLVLHFNKFAETLPLSWILGFYVGIVVNRWWAQFKCIPWPDDVAFRLNAAIKTNDVRSKMTRRTIIRYVNLGITISLLRMLDPAHNPFKELKDLVDEGLLMEDEKKLIEEHCRQHQKPSEKSGKNKRVVFKRSDEDCKPKSFEEFWIPLTWAISLIKKANGEGLIKDEFVMRGMIGEILNIRKMCTSLMCYDWINVPLVYTQVVTIAVYSFFLASLMGSQFLDPAIPGSYPTKLIDLYVPLFTILQFVFYIGWLKVAETLLNPFGGDDDDFEIVYLIRRNKMAGYAIVDDLVVSPPELKKDPNWNEMVTEIETTNVDVRRSIRRQKSVSLTQSKDEEVGLRLETIVESGESLKKKDNETTNTQPKGDDNNNHSSKNEEKTNVVKNEDTGVKIPFIDPNDNVILDDTSDQSSEGSEVTVMVKEIEKQTLIDIKKD